MNDGCQWKTILIILAFIIQLAAIILGLANMTSAVKANQNGLHVIQLDMIDTKERVARIENSVMNLEKIITEMRK